MLTAKTPKPLAVSYRFHKPKSLYEARQRIAENDEAIRTIEAKLADPQWKDKSGRVLGPAQYRRARSKTIDAHAVKLTDNVHLRKWISRQVDNLEKARLDYDPHSAASLLAATHDFWKREIQSKLDPGEHYEVYELMDKVGDYLKGHAWPSDQ